MNDFLSFKKINTFEQLLAAYRKAFGKNDFDALDGGGGSCVTAKQMANHLELGSKIYVFEPFPGNHRFFNPSETQITLMRSALAAENGSMAFRVSSVVDENSTWGKKGMAGYSSVGYLVTGQPTESDILVECVRADDVIPETANIGFIKLDLQGGEFELLLII